MAAPQEPDEPDELDGDGARRFLSRFSSRGGGETLRFFSSRRGAPRSCGSAERSKEGSERAFVLKTMIVCGRASTFFVLDST